MKAISDRHYEMIHPSPGPSQSNGGPYRQSLRIAPEDGDISERASRACSKAHHAHQRHRYTGVHRHARDSEDRLGQAELRFGHSVRFHQANRCPRSSSSALPFPDAWARGTLLIHSFALCTTHNRRFGLLGALPWGAMRAILSMISPRTTQTRLCCSAMRVARDHSLHTLLLRTKRNLLRSTGARMSLNQVRHLLGLQPVSAIRSPTAS